MKAVSLYQPWASAVALRLKRYETRSWSTSYRGPLLIHAAKRWTTHEIQFHRAVQDSLRLIEGGSPRSRKFACVPPLGCIIAVVDLVECWPTDGHQHGHDAEFGPDWTDRLSELERLFGDFGPDRYAWQLANVVRLPEPIPCAGMQGLWTPPGKFIDEINDILDCIRIPQT